MYINAHLSRGGGGGDRHCANACNVRNEIVKLQYQIGLFTIFYDSEACSNQDAIYFDNHTRLDMGKIIISHSNFVSSSCTISYQVSYYFIIWLHNPALSACSFHHTTTDG